VGERILRRLTTWAECMLLLLSMQAAFGVDIWLCFKNVIICVVYWCPNKMDTMWQSLICWDLCFYKAVRNRFWRDLTVYPILISMEVLVHSFQVYLLLRNKVLFFYSPLLGLHHKNCVSGRQVWESLLCSVVIPQILLIL